MCEALETNLHPWMITGDAFFTGWRAQAEMALSSGVRPKKWAAPESILFQAAEPGWVKASDPLPVQEIVTF